MIRLEFEVVGPEFDRRLEEAARELGLSSRRLALKSLPPNVHWHFGKAGSSGTLEATWLMEARKAWLSVRANRRGDWIEAVAANLLERMRH